MNVSKIALALVMLMLSASAFADKKKPSRRKSRVGDVLKTQRGSFAEVLLNPGSFVRLSEDTDFSFQESRAHLGIETQRQWSDLAIARSTPVLMGLYSIVTLTAEALMKSETKAIRTAAWYAKAKPTFSDAIALVRRHLWSDSYFSMSYFESETIKIPRSLFERLTEAVCYAA